LTIAIPISVSVAISVAISVSAIASVAVALILGAGTVAGCGVAFGLGDCAMGARAAIFGVPIGFRLVHWPGRDSNRHQFSPAVRLLTLPANLCYKC
jgi:hypothetical protein